MSRPSPSQKYCSNTVLRGVVYEAMTAAAFENLYDVWYLSALEQAEDLQSYCSQLEGQHTGAIMRCVQAWRRLNPQPLHLKFEKFGPGAENEVQAFQPGDQVPYAQTSPELAPLQLPTYEEVREMENSKRVLNPLQTFIFENEPTFLLEEKKFREELSKLIEWARRQ